MNLYGGPIERNYDVNSNRRKKDPEAVARGAKNNIKKQEKGEFSLTEGQIRDIRGKYDLTCMSEEDEEAFLQHLIEMGILTKTDCNSYLRTGGDISEAVTRQINANIKRMYQLAIAGRDGDSHVEQIRSLQKILDVIGQLKE